WSTCHCCVVRFIVAHSLVGKPVVVLRRNSAVAVSIQPWADVFVRQPQNVGTPGCVVLCLDVLRAKRYQVNGNSKYNESYHDVLLPGTQVGDGQIVRPYIANVHPGRYSRFTKALASSKLVIFMFLASQSNFFLPG